MRKIFSLKILALIAPLLMLVLPLTVANDFGVGADEDWTASEVFAIGGPDSQKEAEIWPNPATDVLNVETSKDIKIVELLNMTGQTEKKVEIQREKKISISVSDSPRGLYLLRITPVSGERMISKVILK